jgi:tetratricopeptide (TPR) repeat protein
MKIFCTYHPTQLASWSCPRCKANLCPVCIVKRNVEQYGTKKDFYFCPKCNIFANKLSITNLIVPFWKRLPHFFTYPLQPAPLALMVVLAIASIFFTEPSFRNSLILFLIWSIMLKYSFAALVSTSNGNLKPPKITLGTVFGNFGIVFKQIGIFLVLAILLMETFKKFGLVVALICLVFYILLIPAMIIILAVTKRLPTAIFPTAIVRMAWRIGWPYLEMYFFLILLAGAPAVLGGMLAVALHGKAYFIVRAFAENYYTLVSYHLMGYVMFQYHEKVGYLIIYEGEEPVPQKGGADTGGAAGVLLNKVSVLIKAGGLDKAIALIKEETGGSISNLTLAERYYNLLSIRQRFPDMIEFGRSYLDLLVKAKQAEKMCQVYQECKSQDAEFTPAPAALYSVARELNNLGKPEDALAAFDELIELDSANPLIQNAQFLMAKIYHEKLHNPAKASEILNYLITTFPFHENTTMVRQYLGKITA